jgi:hypothetical protein
VIHAFAFQRDAAGEKEHEAAEGVDFVLVGRQALVDRFRKLLQFDPRIGFWWVQVPTALFALYLLWRSQRLPRPRQPARARTGAA